MYSLQLFHSSQTLHSGSFLQGEVLNLGNSKECKGVLLSGKYTIPKSHTFIDVADVSLVLTKLINSRNGTQYQHKLFFLAFRYHTTVVEHLC
jgi:hypothetical protein